MSGRTASGSVELTPEHDESTGEQTLAALVTDTLEGITPETIVYCENSGSLDQPTDEWQRYDDVADLPDHTLGGYDELYVYTETHVYRWVGVGFGGGPDVLPRDPSSLPVDE